MRLGPDELATDPDRAPTRPAVELDDAGFPITRKITAPTPRDTLSAELAAERPPVATPTTSEARLVEPMAASPSSASANASSSNAVTPTSDTPVGRLTPRTIGDRASFRFGVAAVGVLGLTALGWLVVRATATPVEPPNAVGAASSLDAGALDADGASRGRTNDTQDDAPQEVVLDARVEGSVAVGARDVRFALRLPAGWSRVDSPVPTVAASVRASEPVGAIVPSANLVIESFEGDTRAYVALGLQNAAPVSTTHGQHVVLLRGGPAVRVEQTFHHGERPYRARTYVNVVDGVGVVLSCYADPEHAREVAPSCDAIAGSLVVE
jgi:hypothetical protein